MRSFPTIAISKRSIIRIGITTTVAISIVLVLHYALHTNVPDARSPAYWAGRIGAIGPSESYEEMVAVANTRNAFDRHIMSHAFGDALYDGEGFLGLRVCDSRASDGCYHQMLARYIREYGTNELNELAAICDKDADLDTVTACKHGIGHGLLAEEGYTIEGLRAALGLCDEVNSSTDWGACHAGAFMEYDERTMKLESDAFRPLDDDASWISPCDEIAGRYEPQCLRRRPYWWNYLLRSVPIVDRMVRLGEMCRKVAGTDTPLDGSCFAGIGRMIAFTADASIHFDTLCDKVASTPVERKWCLTETALGLAFLRGKEYLACVPGGAAPLPAFCIDDSFRPQGARAPQDAGSLAL